MASADWTELTGSLSVGDVLRGATAGFVAPNGGDSFVYGFNSLSAVAGAVGFFTNLVDFAPMVKGGKVTGAVQRSISGGDENYSPFMFIGLQGTSITDPGYMIGLSDEAPHHIVVRKGVVEEGIPSSALGSDGVLAKGSVSYAAGTWLHLRLDMVVNLNGDVVLLAFQNDLNVNTVSSPVWDVIPGMEWSPSPATGRIFIDDVVGANSGSSPFLDGRTGYGFQSEDVSRKVLFDHITVTRQL